MMEFRYRATDPEGQIVSGTIHTPDQDAAYTFLSEKGFHSIGLEPLASSVPSAVKASPLRGEDLIYFNEQWFTVVQARLPLPQALIAIAAGTDNPRIRLTLETIRRHLEAGYSLSDACDMESAAFSPVYRAMIRAGEASGNLPGVLVQLTHYSRRMVEFQGKIVETFAYPLTLIIAAFAVILFILTYVIPAYVKVFFEDGIASIEGMQHVTIMRIWAVMADFAVHHTPGIILTFMIIILGLLYLCLPLPLRYHQRPKWADAMRFRLPGFGTLFRAQSRARFFSTLSMLLEQQIMLPEALLLAGAAADNHAFTKAAQDMAAQVTAGTALAQAMEQPIFDKTTCWMVKQSEEQGQLPQTLATIADYQERFAETHGRWLLWMLGPMITIVIGAIVGLLFLGIYGPLTGYVE